MTLHLNQLAPNTNFFLLYLKGGLHLLLTSQIVQSNYDF